MIFSTCVILIRLCRRNLQLLKCWSLLNTWSCTILRLPCSVLYGGRREMMWWGSASAHILNSDVSPHCAWVIDGYGHCESLLCSSVLHQDNILFSLVSHHVSEHFKSQWTRGPTPLVFHVTFRQSSSTRSAAHSWGERGCVFRARQAVFQNLSPVLKLS